MSALRTLIEAVEAGTLRDIDWSWGAVPEDLSWDQVTAAYDGSVDAALALMEAVLPEWAWEVGTLSRSATVYPPGYPGEDFEDPCYSAEADIPARAFFLAILKAMEATNAGKE